MYSGITREIGGGRYPVVTIIGKMATHVKYDPFSRIVLGKSTPFCNEIKKFVIKKSIQNLSKAHIFKKARTNFK